MHKNEAGLMVLEIGDVVRVGKGKVLYTVTVPAGSDGFVTIRSHNTDKPTTIERDRVNLVESVQSVAYTAGCTVEELDLSTEEADKNEIAAQVERESVTPEPLIGTVASPKDEHTSYQKAILRALNVLGKHVYAGTAKNRTKRARAKLAKKARRNARKAETARFLELSNAEGK